MKKIVLIILGLLLINPLSIKALSKDETVYVKMKSNGKVNSIIATEHLINDGKIDNINDVTNLTNIKNVNGNEKFSLDGKSINWESNKADIYYQGNSDKELPISLSVNYSMDGKELKAKSIIGKKGHVVITINYTNKLSHDINNNTLYTPFMVVSEMNLNSKYNSNIKVTNGKVISNGTTNMIVALSSPGLTKSLNIDNINLDTVTIEYDTTKFSKENIYVVATSKLIDNNDLINLGSISSIKSDINSLSSAANMLVNGTREINSGVDKLKDGAVELSNGIKDALDGSNKIKSAIDDAIDKLNSDNSDALDEDTINMIKNSAIAFATLTEEQLDLIGKQAIAGLKNNENYNNMKNVVDSVEGNEALLNLCMSGGEIPQEYQETCIAYNSYKTVVTALEDTAYSVARTIAANISVKVAGEVSTSVASKVANSVKSEATKKTIDSLGLLSNNIGNLSLGLQKLSDGSLVLVNGIDTLKNGTNTLFNGVNTFNNNGIKKLTSFVNNTLVDKIDTLKSLINLSNNYQSYGGKSDDIKGNTKFIMVVE